MKHTALALLLSATLVSPSFAGGMAEPVMAPVVVIEEETPPASSSANLLPRIIFTLLTGLAMVG